MSRDSPTVQGRTPSLSAVVIVVVVAEEAVAVVGIPANSADSNTDGSGNATAVVVAVKEEEEEEEEEVEHMVPFLNGDGTGENLTGVLQTSGIQNYAWSSGATTPVLDTKADAIRRAATLSFLAYYEPSGVVLHPNDWEDIELTKDANGQYLVAVSVALGGEPKVWRLPVVETPAIPEGTALVGAFGTGAQLYDREQASIRISEQHSDFFVRNAIVVLAEQRLALAVKRPESFVKIDFDSAPEA